MDENFIYTPSPNTQTHKHTTSSKTRCYSLKASVKLKKKKKHNPTAQVKHRSKERKIQRGQTETKITAINLQGFLKKRRGSKKRKKKG